MPIHRAVSTIDSVAKKYNARVSISVPGHKEVVLADHRDPSPEVDTLIELENMVKGGVEQIDRLTSEIKKLTEMMASACLNDEAFRKADEEVKRLTKERQKAKYAILQQPATKQLYEKLQDLKQEKKELTGAQSEYLREYKKISGSNQLELFDGSVMEIITVHKLIKARKK